MIVWRDVHGAWAWASVCHYVAEAFSTGDYSVTDMRSLATAAGFARGLDEAKACAELMLTQAVEDDADA